jgi:hypothetical protein
MIGVLHQRLIWAGLVAAYVILLGLIRPFDIGGARRERNTAGAVSRSVSGRTCNAAGHVIRVGFAICRRASTAQAQQMGWLVGWRWWWWWWWWGRGGGGGGGGGGGWWRSGPGSSCVGLRKGDAYCDLCDGSGLPTPRGRGLVSVRITECVESFVPLRGGPVPMHIRALAQCPLLLTSGCEAPAHVQHGKRVGVGLPAQPRPEARVQWMGARRAGRRGNEVRRSPARPATAPATAAMVETYEI